jgi:protein-tyrosine phosphatase
LTQTVGSLSEGAIGDPRRRIALPGVLNLRDVGGYPVAGGGSVRWRTLFRSDALHRLDVAGAAALAGLGLRTVLDLRTQAEVDIAPSPVRGRVTHLPLLPDLQALQALPAVPDVPGGGLELNTIYRYFVDECGASITAAIGELASDHAFPALVHCSAGKDRTGVVIALILAVLGVPDEVIAADYALSAIYLDPERTPAFGQLRASTGLGDGLTTALLASPPELILEVLDRITATAGSPEGYLRAHGLTGAALSGLRAALIV